jgi:hypothetical protein
VEGKEKGFFGVHESSAGSLEYIQAGQELGYPRMSGNHEGAGDKIGYLKLSGDPEGGRGHESEGITIPGQGYRNHLLPAMIRDHAPGSALSFRITPGLPGRRE